MSGLTVRAPQNGPGSPRARNSARADVGEIDTRAPFRSVKAAVTLFGEAGSPESTLVTKKSNAEERVLETETQHHLIIRELGCYKDQLKNAETAKAQSLRELQRANRTLQQLTDKLENLSESKQASIKAIEAAKIRVKELEEQQFRRAQLGSDAWKVDVDGEKDGYRACTGELNARKQELATLRQDFDAALQEKLAVFQKLEDAQHTAQMNQEKRSQISKEVASFREAIDQVKLVSFRAQEEHSKTMAEKASGLLIRKSAKEEAEKEIKRLKEEYEPKEVLQEKIEAIIEATRVLQDQLNEIQGSDLNSIKAVALELDRAKKKLQEVTAEENLLRSFVQSMKQQLGEVKKERPESDQKALKAESTVQQMQLALERSKTELEASMPGCASVRQSSLEKLSAEAESARHEAEDYKKNAESLKQEAEAARIQTREAEEKLKIALKEAQEAKAAKKLADERIHTFQTSEAAELKGSGSTRKIRLTVEEYESMKKKIEDSGKQADIEVATAMSHLENINASEKEISQKLEVILKENEALQSEINGALKRAETAEAAKSIVERELQKWRQKEQTRAGKISHCSKAE